MSQSGRDFWDWTITSIILAILAWVGVVILASYSVHANAYIAFIL